VSLSARTYTDAVPTVRRAVARAPGFEHDVPYPVAAKVLSADVLHKTEAGGVALGIADAVQFAERVPRMLDAVRAAAPGARLHVAGRDNNGNRIDAWVTR